MRCHDRRKGAAASLTAHDFQFKRLDHEAELPLRDFAGSAILVVNVASACGYTPQYRELEQLWASKRDKGLVVLGVPCNDFGGQERGDEAAIRAFCDSTYHVSFPMTGKVEILGAHRHPFFAWIADALGEGGLPRWNFHKYLIGRAGELVESYPSSVSPLGPKFITEVNRALGREGASAA